MKSRSLRAAIACAFVSCAAASFPAFSETVYVKYRGNVSLNSFQCETVSRSSLVHRLCFNAKERYVIVDLAGTYYHYCAVPPSVVASWRNSQSMGRFYNAEIKGNFDCRSNYLPLNLP